MFTLSVILGSAVLYRDFEKTPGNDAGKFVGGCAMTFLGVYLITSARSRGQDGDDEELEQTEVASMSLRQDGQYRNSVDKLDSDLHGKTPLSIAAQLAEERRNSYLYREGPSSMPPTPIMLPVESPNISSPQISRDRLDSVSPGQYPGESLTNNPWVNSKDDLLRDAPPVLTTTASAPLLPTEVQSIAQSPLNTRHLVDATPLPQTPLPSDRHLSIGGLLVGPLMSPFSASLSAAAAESVRQAAMRAQRSNPRTVGTWAAPERSRLGRDRGSSDADLLSSSVWDDDDDGGEASGTGSPRVRANSLGGGLGSIIEYFRTPVKRREDSGRGAGRSGSLV